LRGVYGFGRRKMKLSFFFVFVSFVAVVAVCDLQETIRKLSDELVGLQVKKQEDLYMPPFFWIKQKGTFPRYERSVMHLHMNMNMDTNINMQCFSLSVHQLCPLELGRKARYEPSSS
jgi:hypothetical protein